MPSMFNGLEKTFALNAAMLKTSIHKPPSISPSEKLSPSDTASTLVHTAIACAGSEG